MAVRRTRLVLSTPARNDSASATLTTPNWACLYCLIRLRCWGHGPGAWRYAPLSACKAPCSGGRHGRPTLGAPLTGGAAPGRGTHRCHDTGFLGRPASIESCCSAIASGRNYNHLQYTEPGPCAPPGVTKYLQPAQSSRGSPRRSVRWILRVTPPPQVSK